MLEANDIPLLLKAIRDSLPDGASGCLRVLDLLAPHRPVRGKPGDPEAVVFRCLVIGLARGNVRALTDRLLKYAADSPVHRDVAHGLAILGDARAVPIVQEAMKSPDEYVRSGVFCGIAEGAQSGYSQPAFQAAMFDLLTDQLSGTDGWHAREVCVGLLSLDRERAVAIVTRPSVLHGSNPNLCGILEALTECHIELPAASSMTLLDALVALPETYRNRRSLGLLLMMLAKVSPQDAIRRATPVLDNTDADLRRAASEAIARAHGLRGPMIGCDADEYERLPVPTRVMVDLGDAFSHIEGDGLSSLIANNPPEKWRVFAAAYQTIGAARSAAIIEELGRRWGEADFELGTIERSLEPKWQEDEDRRDKLMLEYVLKNRAHFMLPPGDRPR